MDIPTLYRALAADQAERAALTFARAPFVGLSRTWRELVQRADDVAATLARSGVGPGTRCAVELVDHPDALPILLGAWSLGAVTVLVDPEWGDGLRESVLRHSRADLDVRIDPAAHALPDATLVVTPVRVPDPHPTRPPLPPDTALLAFTSGSTGSPKAIPVRHERLTTVLLSTAAAITTFRGDAPRRTGSSMRLSGYGVLVLHLLWSAAFRAETVVLPRLDLQSSPRYWADVEEHQIDQTVLVPPLYELLVRATRPDGHSTRPLFINSSGPLSAATHAQFQQRFGSPLLNCYGLTETTFACAPGDMSVPGTSTPSIGPGHLAWLRLRDATGAVVEGPGTGELEVFGPVISDGYYDNDAANAALLRGPWVRTGDLAERDAGGRYTIVGRLKDAVMKGGHTVYLNEVEEACLALPDVVEAIAIRIDLPAGNEDVVVLARPHDGRQLEPAAVLAAVRTRLGVERSPRRVHLVHEALPRIGQDKPDRVAAAALWAARSRTTTGAAAAAPARAGQDGETHGR